MGAATLAGGGMGFARQRAKRRISFSPFDPKTPHLRFAVVSILLLWLLVFSVLSLLPKQFASKSTLIVPGATQSVSVSLDRIGQSTTSPAQAYNTVALSPKVIYKEMLLSDEVRQAAARTLGLTLGEFGAPRIKLVDETALINIELRGRDADAVYRRHVALIGALQARLDRLRAEELELRTAAVKENMRFYEDNVAEARRKITALQQRTGLQNEAQFNEVTATLVRRTQRLAEQRADLDRSESERANVAARVGVDPATAALALRIVADPTMAKWLSDYADARTAAEAEARRLGPENPALLFLTRKVDVLREQILQAARRIGGTADARMLEVLMLITTQSQQADLFKQLILLDSTTTGKRAEVDMTARDVAALENEQRRLGSAASELEDLKKSMLVAEAVFSTAMARIHTTKSDIYGSYPLIQTLAAPSMPTGIAGAQFLFGLAGGVLGTLLLALGWFLAWLRTGSGPKILKSA